MHNIYLPKIAVIKEITKESADTKLFKLVLKNKQKEFTYNNGQFLIVGLPGAGEAAFNLCSNPLVSKRYLEISVRKVGRLTNLIHQLKVGDHLFIRGPYGRGWPKFTNLPTNNLLLVGGGCGFIPLRSVVLEIFIKTLRKKLANFNIQIFYGCATFDNLLFKKELRQWQQKLNLKIIFDKEKVVKKFDSLQCDVGLITKLFDLYPIDNTTTAFLCGPPLMYKFVIEKLKKINVPDQNIYLSLERRMECGDGICQHCASGDLYVCKDGPVFRYDEIKDTELI